MADYAEQLFDAVSILTESQTNNLDFNTTIKATITDNSNASSGVYSATDGKLTFNAYSSDTTYEIGDRVYIVIPNNNTDNQRIILGKIISAGSAQYVASNIFSSFVDISDNLIEDNPSGELVANSMYKEEVLLWSYGFDAPVSNYNKIGIKGSFRTWLNNYDLIAGDYGLRLEITTVDSGNSYGKTYSMIFSCEDMDGSIYNFSSYHFQQALFDISSINNIKYLSLYFYQTNGSFIDSDNNEISQTNTISDLFVKGLYLAFGYDKNKLVNNVDSVELITSDLIAYTLNEIKTIKLNWIHWIDSSTCQVVKEDSDLEYEVRWYRYALDCGDTDDLYMNKNWQKIEADATAHSINFTTNKINQTEQIQAVVVCPSSLTSGESILYSNILIFENTKQTVNPVLVDSGLTINCLDGSEGLYYLYGTGNIILNQSDANQIRTLDLSFTQGNDISIDILSEDVNYETTWEFGYKDENGNNCTDSSMFEVINDPPKNPLQLNYKIRDFYSGWQTVNTVKCTVTLPDTGYTISAIKELKFGVAGTQGADATLLISFKDSHINIKDQTYFQCALIKGETECEFKVQLFDDTNKEVDLSAQTVKWDILEGSANGYTITAQNPSNTAILSNSNGFQLNDLVFITATLEESAQVNYTLTTTFPVPITEDRVSYNYINGTTSVIYSMAGLPAACSTPYEIFNYQGKKYEGTVWQIYPSDNDDVNIENNILQPASVYLKDFPLYGVQAVQNGEIIWSQPVLVQQNPFFSSTINKWDGTTLSLSQEEGTLVGRSLAAGRKKNNKFSGVIMGDWSEEIDGLALTGLYGIEEGVLSYGFKEDGTAFIGKAGSGQIKFDGNSSTIYSTGAEFTNDTGSFIDLDDGKVRFKENFKIDSSGKVTIGAGKSSIVIDASQQTIKGSNTEINLGTGYVKLGNNFTVDSGTVTIGAGNSSIVIDSSQQIIKGTNTEINLANGYIKLGNNLEIATTGATKIGNYFSVSETGLVTIGTATKGITIDASSQQIKGTNTMIDLNTGVISLGGSGVFTVDASGNLTLKGSVTATAGKIGDWSISNGGLIYNNTISLTPTQFKFNDYFTVNSDGLTVNGDITATNLTATTAGTIGNWTIGSTGLTYKDTFALTPGQPVQVKFGTNFKIDDSGNVIMNSANINGNLNLGASGYLNGIYGVIAYVATGKKIGAKKGKTFQINLADIIASASPAPSLYRPVALIKIWTNYSSKCKIGGFNIVYHSASDAYVSIRLINTGSAIDSLQIKIKLLFLKTTLTENFGINEDFTGEDANSEDSDEIEGSTSTTIDGTTYNYAFLDKESQKFTKSFTCADNIYMTGTQDTENTALATIQWIKDQSFLTSDDLSSYATKTWVSSSYATSKNLTNLEKRVEALENASSSS